MPVSNIPKPYTAYTIYWRLERIHILQEAGYIDDEIKAVYDPNHFDELEHPRPTKYKNTVLPPYWYSSMRRQELERKRKHRKQEGAIDKTVLTAIISKRWRELESEVRDYVMRLANTEKLKHKELLGITRSSPSLKLTTTREIHVVTPSELSSILTADTVSDDQHLTVAEIGVDSDTNIVTVFNQNQSLKSKKAEDKWIDCQLTRRYSGSGTISDEDLKLFDSDTPNEEFQFDFSQDDDYLLSAVRDTVEC